MAEEGWYSDPYRRHGHRWFSDGKPTALVRDAGTTSRDAPPDGPYLCEPELIDPPPSPAALDLRRAGEADGAGVDAVDAVWTYVASRPAGF